METYYIHVFYVHDTQRHYFEIAKERMPRIPSTVAILRTEAWTEYDALCHAMTEDCEIQND